MSCGTKIRRFTGTAEHCRRNFRRRLRVSILLFVFLESELQNHSLTMGSSLTNHLTCIFFKFLYAEAMRLVCRVERIFLLTYAVLRLLRNLLPCLEATSWHWYFVDNRMYQVASGLSHPLSSATTTVHSNLL